MSVLVTPRGSTTGLKSVTKLHASTFVDGRVEVDGGKLVKAEVNVPPNQLEVLDVASEFFVIDNETGDEVQLETKEDDLQPFQACSPEIVSNIFGVKFCATGAYSNHPTNYFYPNNRYAIINNCFHSEFDLINPLFFDIQKLFNSTCQCPFPLKIT